MVVATKIYDGTTTDTSAIITAVGTTAFSQLAFIVTNDGVGLQIYFQGS